MKMEMRLDFSERKQLLIHDSYFAIHGVLSNSDSR